VRFLTVGAPRETPLGRGRPGEVGFQAMAVAGREDHDPAQRQASAESAVGRDHPCPESHGRLDHGVVPPSGRRKDSILGRESPRRRGPDGAACGQPVKLSENGEGHGEDRARPEAVDLRFQRETGADREKEGVGVQENERAGARAR